MGETQPDSGMLSLLPASPLSAREKKPPLRPDVQRHNHEYSGAVLGSQDKINSTTMKAAPTEKPVERTASVETDRLQPAASAAKPPLPEDLFGSVPFVANAGKS